MNEQEARKWLALRAHFYEMEKDARKRGMYIVSSHLERRFREAAAVVGEKTPLERMDDAARDAKPRSLTRADVVQLRDRIREEEDA